MHKFMMEHVCISESYFVIRFVGYIHNCIKPNTHSFELL